MFVAVLEECFLCAGIWMGGRDPVEENANRY